MPLICIYIQICMKYVSEILSVCNNHFAFFLIFFCCCCQSENIKLDPELFHGCENDINDHCHKITAGNARVLECLREHKEDLSDSCHRKLFNREKVQAKNPDTDFAFMHACKPMIKVCISSLYYVSTLIILCLSINKH